ncbi:MAG: polysaccharide deacetylase family protein [Bacteroidota bacterium]|jgi:peptidoglycan/xylan/chitin deacetylase (PgdA/CDA1 family)
MSWDIQILKRLFPSILFNITDESVHLTFDDGPHPIATPLILQELKRHNIRATFFLLGQNAQKFPDLVHQIHTEGHQIGNHSFTHDKLIFKNKAFIQNEILETMELLEKIIGPHSQYFRPPYGYFNCTILNVLRELGLTCTLWNVDSKDYKLNSVAEISHRVIPNTTNGSILLFHENNKISLNIQTYLPILLDILINKGFNFKTLPI